MFVAGNGGGIATIAVAFAVYLGKVVRPLEATAVVLSLPDWDGSPATWCRRHGT